MTFSFFGELNDNNEFIIYPYLIIQQLNEETPAFYRKDIVFVIDKDFEPEFNNRYNSYFIKIKQIIAYDIVYNISGFIYIHDLKNTRVFDFNKHSKVVYRSKYDEFRNDEGVMIKYFSYYYVC